MNTHETQNTRLTNLGLSGLDTLKTADLVVKGFKLLEGRGIWPASHTGLVNLLATATQVNGRVVALDLNADLLARARITRAEINNHADHDRALYRKEKVQGHPVISLDEGLVLKAYYAAYHAQ